MMEGPRHQHLHQEWQEPLEELVVVVVVVVAAVVVVVVVCWCGRPSDSGGRHVKGGRKGRGERNLSGEKGMLQRAATQTRAPPHAFP